MALTKEALLQAMEADICAKAQAAALIFAECYAKLADKAVPGQEDILNFPAQLAEWPANRKPLLQSFKQQRETMIAHLRHFKDFTLYYGLISKWLQYHFNLYHIADISVPVTEVRPLFNRHLEFIYQLLEGSEDKEADFLEIAEGFIAQIPLRMTRGRYKDYLTHALKQVNEVYEDTLDYILNEFEAVQAQLTGPVSLPPFCVPFKAELDAFWQLAPSSIEEAEPLMEQIDDFRARLTETCDALFDALDAIDAALILLEYGRETDIALLNQWLNNPDPEALDKAIQSAVTAISENDLRSRVSQSDDVQQDPIYASWKALNELYYESALQYYYGPPALPKDNTRFASAQEKTAAILAVTDACAEGLNSRRKRFLRQHFMGLVPFGLEGGMRAYQQYFIDTYNALDTTHKHIMEFNLYQFQQTLAERFGVDFED